MTTFFFNNASSFNLQRNFVCRSAEYNYVTLQCRLSDYDRRTLEDSRQSINLVEAQGVDYFENLCLDHTTACDKERSYQPPANYGIPAQKVAAHVKINFYVDKELMVNHFSLIFMTFLMMDL